LSSAFLVNVSHEFRTPLNGLMGTSALLAESPLSPQQKEWVELMRQSAQGLFEVLNNVLDYARLQAGDLTLRLDGFSIKEMLKDIATPLAPRAEGKGLTFVLQSPPEDLVLRGDTERVKQVLTHLANNALKFTEKGGITVAAEVLSTQGQEVRVRFTVSDTGLGIPPEQRERIFQAYSQGDNSTTRAQGGLGLGLALSEKLVAYMGGSLKMESALGQGSKFIIELPFEKGTTVSVDTKKILPEPDKNGSASPRRHYRILLVDDNVINQKVAQMQLEKLGYHADVAGNGREAVEMYGRRPYDLVLMDCQMPELDGYGATEAIRKTEDKKRHVPIVAVTANASDEDRERCRAAGMDEYLTKPLAIETLSSLLARWDRSIDSETLNGLKELGEESFPQLRDDFLAQTRDQIAQLRKSLESKEWKPAKSAAHKVKGTSGTFGAVRLQKLGR
jgi:CheY-like chemotaxis protein